MLNILFQQTFVLFLPIKIIMRLNNKNKKIIQKFAEESDKLKVLTEKIF